jgi:hypothetical protein
MTLGGTFGAGPAWHSRLETGLSHVWTTDDAVFVYGGQSLDLPGRVVNWQAGAGYRRPVFTTRKQALSVVVGFQHWQFRGVKCGTHDWLSHHGLTYRALARGKLPLQVTTDSWTLYRSPLPTGTAVHTQVWTEHTVLRKESVRVTLRHGPAHTYSWGFYGTDGHRVVRYQTMLGMAWRGTRFEGGWRKQWGLQQGIPNNSYWQFCVSRSVQRSAAFR